MKRIFLTVLIGAAIITVTGCSSDYVMSTKSGELIVTHGKPEIDRNTGMTRYTDEQGDDRQINTNEVVQMIQKD
ncbi:putative lipoprotein YgdR precursor [compost metagenome]|uniref:YgdI/YgdR family lipoprotein n=1 Tax=Kluyvera intermedia TaxID=61648 RepID=UPI000FBFB847